MSLRWTAAVLSGLAASLVAAPAMAQKPISFVVAYTAGGTTDTFARIVGERLAEKLGQPVLIENRAGATGQIGSRHVAKSAPDGLTIQLATQTTHAVAPSLYGEIGYDPIKDFTPITLAAWSPLVLITHPSVPVKTAKDLVEYVKGKKNEVSYATGGRGDGSHMAALFFNGLAGISPTAVPHQGEAPALPQVLGGHIPYMFCSAPTAASVIAANQVNGIAVTSKQRSRILPNTPTMEQAGLPGYEMVNWWGIFGPAGMPTDLVEKYNKAFKEILQEPATKAKLEAIGFELTGTSSQEFADYIKAENVKWAKVIQEQGLKPN